MLLTSSGGGGREKRDCEKESESIVPMVYRGLEWFFDGAEDCGRNGEERRRE